MLNSINLTKFVPYDNTKFEFKQGINIITGANRSGKSQILEGISYGYFGKTKNSKIAYIIKPGADKATIGIESTEFKLKRVRTKATSKLNGLTKSELDSHLNLDYQEFLRIFYVSSSESFTLFDPTYFRKFLIGLFDLEQYSKAHQKCKMEYNMLNQVEDKEVQIDEAGIKSKLVIVDEKITKFREDIKVLQIDENKLRAVKNELYKKSGVLEGKIAGYRKQKELLEMSKCPKCLQDVGKDYKTSIYKELVILKPKLKEYKDKIAAKQEDTREKLNVVLASISALEDKITKGIIIESTLNERLQQKPTKRNTKRIKELEQIIPILAPKGFPSHLLQRYIPVIQETANNLLSSIFNDININIRTVKPDGHTPDLKVMINMNGQTKELKDYCGAETVLINLCLRLGVLVIFKQLHNTCIDFMMLDESMEKLDEDISLRVIKLLRSFISMGYLKQIILVTHKKELKDLEDVNYIKLGE